MSGIRRGEAAEVRQGEPIGVRQSELIEIRQREATEFGKELAVTAPMTARAARDTAKNGTAVAERISASIPNWTLVYILMEQTQLERSRITPAFKALVYEAFEK